MGTLYNVYRDSYLKFCVDTFFQLLIVAESDGSCLTDLPPFWKSPQCTTVVSQHRLHQCLVEMKAAVSLIWSFLIHTFFRISDQGSNFLYMPALHVSVFLSPRSTTVCSVLSSFIFKFRVGNTFSAAFMTLSFLFLTA